MCTFQSCTPVDTMGAGALSSHLRRSAFSISWRVGWWWPASERGLPRAWKRSSSLLLHTTHNDSFVFEIARVWWRGNTAVCTTPPYFTGGARRLKRVMSYFTCARREKRSRKMIALANTFLKWECVWYNVCIYNFLYRNFTAKNTQLWYNLMTIKHVVWW